MQSQDTNTAGVVGQVIQCKREDGVLSVKVRFRNNSDKESRFYILPDTNYEKVYIAAASKKYFILKDSQGAYLAPAPDYTCGLPGVCARLGPGNSYTWWAKFPAPAADVKKVNLMTPSSPPFEDIPIVDK